MLTILTTTESYQKVQDTIDAVDRLNELVTVTQEPDGIQDLKTVMVDADTIRTSLDWYDLEPPYLFPTIPFEQNSLLALVFYKLGNQQRAFDFVSEEHPMYHHLLTATHLQFGYEITDDMLEFSRRHSPHNVAILYHYGVLQNPVDTNTIEAYYEAAILGAENDEVSVYTAKHFINLAAGFR